MSRNPYLAASRPFTRSSRSSKRTDLGAKTSSLARSRSTTGLSSNYGNLGNAYSSAAGYTPASSSSSTSNWVSSRPTYDNSYNKQYPSVKSLSSLDQEDNSPVAGIAKETRSSRLRESHMNESQESPRSHSLSRVSSANSPSNSFDRESYDDSNSVKFTTKQFFL